MEVLVLVFSARALVFLKNDFIYLFDTHIAQKQEE